MTEKSCNLLELGVNGRERVSGTISASSSDDERYKIISKSSGCYNMELLRS